MLHESITLYIVVQYHNRINYAMQVINFVHPEIHSCIDIVWVLCFA